MAMSPESRAEISPEELEELEEWKTRLLKEKHQLKGKVSNLREALEGATSALEDTLSELKLMNPKRQNHNEEARIKRFRATLEATKGAT